MPASVFSLMILRGQIAHRGVFPPEALDREEISRFYDGIRDWGINVIRQVETTAD